MEEEQQYGPWLRVPQFNSVRKTIVEVQGFESLGSHRNPPRGTADCRPTYTNSCFKLPNALCDELTSMIRNFRWGQKEEDKKIAWLSWKKMCEPKSN